MFVIMSRVSLLLHIHCMLHAFNITL